MLLIIVVMFTNGWTIVYSEGGLAVSHPVAGKTAALTVDSPNQGDSNAAAWGILCGTLRLILDQQGLICGEPELGISGKLSRNVQGTSFSRFLLRRFRHSLPDIAVEYSSCLLGTSR